MKIFGLTVVKNEADIIGQSLTDALRWCERIGVVDNGSTDNTVMLIEELQHRSQGRILFCGIEERPFSNDLRRIPFEKMRPDAKSGDWWCRLDADEFYPVDPRRFLKGLKPHEYVVWSAHLQYYYTELDYAEWKRGAETLEDRSRPIQARRRYYKSNSSEARFFRHRPELVWKDGCAWPKHLGLVARRRIPVQHFQYRDPEQIKSRLAARKIAFANGHHNWGDNDPDAWTERIVDAKTLDFDTHDGVYNVQEELMPRHLEKRAHRVAKRIMHRLKIWP